MGAGRDRRRFVLNFTVVVALLIGEFGLARAEGSATLLGNHPRFAEGNPGAGLLPLDRSLSMAVTLSLQNQAELDQLVADQQNPASPLYHQWLTADQFTARFGPSQEQVDQVAGWLSGQGFTIVSSSAADRIIRFTGTVAQAQSAFHTTLRSFGGNAFGNLEDPAIPASFAGVISAIHGLHNLQAAMPASREQFPQLNPARIAELVNRPQPLEMFALVTGDLPTATDRGFQASSPDYKIGASKTFSPADFRNFYDENPILNSGIDGGGGDCIAIVGDSDFQQSSINAFNSTFGLPASSITTKEVSGSDPGFFGSDELEALLDLEWSHAVAPGAPQRFYLGNSNTPTISPIVDEIQSAVSENQCGVISVSFALCGGDSSFFLTTVSPIYTQAAAQGQSILVSAGDSGSAGITYSALFGCVVASSPTINELGADPNVTTVGGASFTPKYDAQSADTSTVSGLASRVWNDPHDGKKTGGATGGGASLYYGKPIYQTGLGVPDDGLRDVPDLAMIASPYFPGAATYVDNDCIVGLFGCDGSGAPTAYPFGGTSLSAPVTAGVAKLIAEATGSRPGPLNPTLYAIANGPDYAAVFKDVTTGNNGYNGVAGFKAGAGFDLSTGWGAFDIASLVDEIIGAPLPGPASLKLAPAKTLAFGNVDYAAAGSASAVKKLTITNLKKNGRPAQINSIGLPAGFSADPACLTTIAVGGKLTCNITFTPTALGAVVGGALTVNSNALASPQSIALTGAGVQGKLTVTPKSLAFTKIPVGTTSTAKLVTLNNKTGSSFTIAAIHTGNPALFSAAGCGGVLAAHSTCQVSVAYKPTGVTKATDTLTVTDDASGGQQTVSLSGTGQ